MQFRNEKIAQLCCIVHKVLRNALFKVRSNYAFKMELRLKIFCDGIGCVLLK